MNRPAIKIILLGLLICDLVFSFIQHYYKALDGDMASIILGYPEVMSDPFGFQVLSEQKIYGGTNRFFAHWTMSAYFKHAPVMLQALATPVESVYLSCAIAKTIVQSAIIIFTAFFVTGNFHFRNGYFLFSALIISVLLQTNGYGGYMGIIDSSITYTFFYALQFALLLLFIIFLKKLMSGKENQSLPVLKTLGLFFFSVILALGGPLNSAVILIGIFVWLLYKSTNPSFSLKFIKESTARIKILIFSIVVICLYSIFLGFYNAENFFTSVAVFERYSLLPLGLFNSFTQKLGLPLLAIAIIANIILIRRFCEKSNYNNMLLQSKYLGIFCLLYLLIIPLGGFREYRPNIVRADTLIPVTICMIYLFALTSVFLIRQSRNPINKSGILYISIVLTIFAVADLQVKKENVCEKESLLKLARSNDQIVRLDPKCNVLSWRAIDNPKDSELNCTLLRHWNVIYGPKQYYQHPDPN